MWPLGQQQQYHLGTCWEYTFSAILSPYLSPRWHEHWRSQALLTFSSTPARGQLEGGFYGLSKLTQLEDRDGFVLLFVLGIKICFKLQAVPGPNIILLILLL